MIFFNVFIFKLFFAVKCGHYYKQKKLPNLEALII